MANTNNYELAMLMSPGGRIGSEGQVSEAGGHHPLSISDRTDRIVALVGCNPEDIVQMRAGRQRYQLVLKVSWRRHIPPAITSLCMEVGPVIVLCEIWMEQCGFKMSRALRWHMMRYLLPLPTTMVERSALERLPFDTRLLAILDS